MNECLSEAEKQKREERERKKAEVRARLEAASHANKKKAGFMTPERKKKLRLLLRRKAAEELKRQQEAKANERRKIILERTGEKVPLDSLTNESKLIDLCKQYYKRIEKLESEKYDLEYSVRKKDYEISELSSKVNDMRGKFMKPPLRKIPKFEAKIERMLLNARKEIGFTVALKSVKKDQLAEPKVAEKSAPEWSWKNKAQGE